MLPRIPTYSDFFHHKKTQKKNERLNQMAEIAPFDLT